MGPFGSRPVSGRFERWTVTIPAGAELAASAADWEDTIARVNEGAVEVGCLSGTSLTFRTGDMLALGCLPLAALRNVGQHEAQIVVVRRKRRSR